MHEYNLLGLGAVVIVVLALVRLIFWLGEWYANSKSTGRISKESTEDALKLKEDVGDLKKDFAYLKTDVGDLKTDVGSLKSGVGDLKKDVDYLKVDVGDLKKDVSYLKMDVGDLKSDVKLVLARLGPHKITENSSPVRLTAYGKKLAESIDADGLVQKYASHIEIKEDMNEYRIQEACFGFAQNDLPRLLSKTDENAVEKLAYDEGIGTYGVFQVIGIKLRDWILSSRGKNISDIDMHDPAKPGEKVEPV